MEITKAQAIEDLKKIFNVSSDMEEHRKGKLSFCTDEGDFFIDKRDCEYYGVLEKLQDYFKDKVIKDGQCRIDSIVLLYTTFHIEDRKK